MSNKNLHRKNVVACIWDFDKTLTPGYMQQPIFAAYGIDEEEFWAEVNALPAIYAGRGNHVSSDTIYLNHLLSYVKNGPLKGLTNARLRELGSAIRFYPGLPGFLAELRRIPETRPEFRKHDIVLEHYIISTGLAEMVRGSAVAAEVDGIFACEFIEAPLPPHYQRQDELPLEMEFEISQIGVIVDNTIKTRFVFEINKGGNKNPEIDVNAKMARADRRVPVDRMIYVADGPSDVPVFSVIRKYGGRAFAVFNPDSRAEFAQNDRLLRDGRIDAYGPADYRGDSTTAKWLKMHVEEICERVVQECEQAVSEKVGRPPRHLHAGDEGPAGGTEAEAGMPQADLFEAPEQSREGAGEVRRSNVER